MIRYPLSYNPILEYWNDIETGRIVVGEKVRRIYKHLADKLENNKESEFEYDPERANHAIEFIENFTCHSKGKLGGTKVVLEKWQKAFLGAVFGFVHKIDGTRQYRELFLVVARKNGRICRL